MEVFWNEHGNLFYWGWLFLWMLRVFANHQVYLKRGESAMNAYKPMAFLHPESAKASALVHLTFYFPKNNHDSHVLKQQVVLVNLLHFSFVIYTICLVLLGFIY